MQDIVPAQTGNVSHSSLTAAAKANLALLCKWPEARTSPWQAGAGTGPQQAAQAAAPHLPHAAPTHARAALCLSRRARQCSAMRPRTPASWRSRCLHSSAAPQGVALGNACQAAGAVVRPACLAGAEAPQASPAGAERRPKSCRARTGTRPAFCPLALQHTQLPRVSYEHPCLPQYDKNRYAVANALLVQGLPFGPPASSKLARAKGLGTLLAAPEKLDLPSQVEEDCRHRRASLSGIAVGVFVLHKRVLAIQVLPLHYGVGRRRDAGRRGLGAAPGSK